MNFVKTNRAKLNPSTYSMDVLDQPRDRSFYTTFPAPVAFKIPSSTTYLSPTQTQLLAVWYLRGTAITYNNITATAKHTVQQWVYTFVSQLPQHYILMGKTTPQLAYDYGKLLIDKCTKASNITITQLELAYKELMRAFWSTPLSVFSPNQKTFLEVSAEMKTAKEIKGLSRCSKLAKTLNEHYNDTELDYYCRIFDIQTPNWAIAYTMHKTEKHGYAAMPYVKMDDYVPMNNQRSAERSFATRKITDKATGRDKQLQVQAFTQNNAGYAAFDQDREFIPSTLQRDARPKKLENKALRAQLCEQVEWYLNTFRTTNDLTLLADGWSYCTTCGFYQTNASCACGQHQSIADVEQELILEAYATMQDFTELYDSNIEQIAAWANYFLPIDKMSKTEILRAVVNKFGAVR